MQGDAAMPEKKLYFYDVFGLLETECNGGTMVVSEGKLPRKTRGKCALDLPHISKKTPAGTVLDLIVGDPRIVKGATLLARNSKGMPKEFRRVVENVFWCFRLPKELGGGRMWVNYDLVVEVPKR